MRSAPDGRPLARLGLHTVLDLLLHRPRRYEDRRHVRAIAGLAGLGIDNVDIDVAGPEIPIMDGSAGPFVFLLQSAGIVEQEVAKKYLRVVEPVEVRDGDKWARFDPFYGFKLDFTIDFPHPMFGSENRQVVIDFAEHSYVKEVARARTFGFMHDVEAMRAAG